METEQNRSAIRFLFLEGKSRSEIKERLDVVYGDSSPSMATVKIDLTSFNVVARLFLMSHAQVLRNGLTLSRVVQSEQTRHPSRRQLPRAQYFMQDMTHEVF